MACVQGAALGGGAGLVAVADIAVAEEAAQFGFTEVRLGLVPAVISPYVVRKTGVSSARELFLTGERFTAARAAAAIGLVHRVVKLDELDAAVDERVRELLLAAPGAVAAAKALLHAVAGHPVKSVRELVCKRIAERRNGSAEGQEGVRPSSRSASPTGRVGGGLELCLVVQSTIQDLTRVSHQSLRNSRPDPSRPPSCRAQFKT